VASSQGCNAVDWMLSPQACVDWLDAAFEFLNFVKMFYLLNLNKKDTRLPALYHGTSIAQTMILVLNVSEKFT